MKKRLNIGNWRPTLTPGGLQEQCQEGCWLSGNQKSQESEGSCCQWFQPLIAPTVSPREDTSRSSFKLLLIMSVTRSTEVTFRKTRETTPNPSICHLLTPTHLSTADLESGCPFHVPFISPKWLLFAESNRNPLVRSSRNLISGILAPGIQKERKKRRETAQC